MADLFVDESGLRDVAWVLNNCAEMMAQAVARLASATTSNLGDATIDSAAQNFSHQWQYGIGKMKDAYDNLGQQIDAGVDAYQKIDGELASVLRGRKQ